MKRVVFFGLVLALAGCAGNTQGSSGDPPARGAYTSFGGGVTVR